MLRIRPDQVKALNASYRDEYVQRTRGDFRLRWPDECSSLDDEELEDLIRAARGSAESYGIETVGDVVLFTEAWLLIGDDFDTNPDYPWADRILQDTAMSGSAKASAIRHQTLLLLDEIAREGEAN
ncbi:MAG: hypothetical protein ACI80K_003514 [Paracoccaceae bacterium]|jgi:hypothetical protein